MAYGGNVRRRHLALRFWSRPARVLGLVALTGLLAPGLAGCEYADLEPLPTQTAAPTPDAYVETVEARESRLAMEAKFQELLADVEAQLGTMPETTLGGSAGGMRDGQGSSFTVSITKPGVYTALMACSPEGEAIAQVIQADIDASLTTEFPVSCGTASETAVELVPGDVTIGMRSLGPEFAVGSIYLVKPAS
ncbi:hypothetical protein V1639_03510 [Pseudarthrobacter sp. J75]|uniref:hypothetical protein n=1 Tax=unclassified Pseudarthrobacter TaxID=2647000 RepID=UPI002E7FB796|nr:MULTISPECIES: hypothetical protein [unclassified Pseudarthrobacter]MEE2522257.1 hypothetical protein [Pseudarthrobacter sp. J47]MEE2528097.1 hypothetical protein [Pseudarthrobacter sp. J75]